MGPWPRSCGHRADWPCVVTELGRRGGPLGGRTPGCRPCGPAGTRGGSWALQRDASQRAARTQLCWERCPSRRAARQGARGARGGAGAEAQGPARTSTGTEGTEEVLGRPEEQVSSGNSPETGHWTDSPRRLLPHLLLEFSGGCPRGCRGLGLGLVTPLWAEGPLPRPLQIRRHHQQSQGRATVMETPDPRGSPSGPAPGSA